MRAQTQPSTEEVRGAIPQHPADSQGIDNPPVGLIPVPLKGAVLLLTEPEYLAGIRRGKWWRRREAAAKRRPRP